MTGKWVCSNFQQHLLKPGLKTSGATGPQNYGNKSNQKETPPRAGAWDLLIKPGSLGVGRASVGQAWMSIVSDFFAAGVVVLAAVGQLDTSFGRGCWSFVGVTSVEKSSHG